MSAHARVALPILLTGANNFTRWTEEMEAYLLIEDAWDIVIGAVGPKQGFSPETDLLFHHIGEGAPEGPAPAARLPGGVDPKTRIPSVDAPRIVDNETFRKRCNGTLALILGRVDSDHKKLLSTTKSPYHLWKDLEMKLNRKGPSYQVKLHNEYDNIRAERYSSIDKFVTAFSASLEDQKKAGIPLQGVLAQSDFIKRLPDKYDTWKANVNIRFHKDQIPTMTELISEFNQERGLIESSENSTEHVANTAQKSNNKRHHGGSSNSPNKAPKKYCENCKKNGHLKDTCYWLYPDKAPEKWRKAVAEKKAKKEAAKAAKADEHPAGSSEAPYGFTATVNPIALRTTHQSSFAYDTGATVSVCNQKEFFTGYKASNNRETLKGISGDADIKGTGSINLLLTQTNGSKRKLKLDDVLYVPDAINNLISGSLLEDRGIYLDGKRRRLVNNDTELCALDRLDGLYYLRCEAEHRPQAMISTHNTEEGRPLTASSIPSLEALWHQRLGHPGDRTLHLLGQQLGFKTSPKSPGTALCGPCQEANMTRRPSYKPMTRAADIGELIHSDVFGEVTPLALGGVKYVVVFTDDYSRARWAFYLTSKDQAHNRTLEFEIRFRTQFNKPILRFRRDRGLEYGGNALANWLKSKGISDEPTVGYTPEMNGVSERTNRLITSKARAMMLASKMPLDTWHFAVQAAVWIINRLPSKSLNNQSPLQTLFGKFDPARWPLTGPNKYYPNLARARVFGCVCYIYIPEEKRTKSKKFESRAERANFIGYGNADNIYIVYQAGKGVKQVRDVRFDESFFATDHPISCDSDSDDDEIKEGASDPSEAPAPPARGAASTNGRSTLPETQNLQKDASRKTAKNSTQETQDYVYTSNPSRPSNPPSPSSSLSQTIQLISHPVVLSPPVVSDLSGVSFRKSVRHRKPSRKAAYVASVEQIPIEPETYAEAIASPQSTEWQQAMQAEITSLDLNKTWTLTEKPHDRKALKGKWVYKIKLNSDNTVARYKARWVAKGFAQREGIDYEETYAAVAKAQSIRTLLAFACALDWEIEQMDVVTAFLNPPIDKDDIYMDPPTGFEKRGLSCLLKKTLYGLKQSAAQWFKMLSNALKGLGLAQLNTDESVFLKATEKGPILIATYVDDLVLLGPSHAEISNIKKELANTFKMVDLGTCGSYLGLQIQRDRSTKTLKISQTAYIQRILLRFRMNQANPVATPIDPTVTILPAEGTPNEDAQRHFQSIIGSVMYCQTQTRPDIAYGVSLLSRFSSNPRQEHINAAKRLLRYLRGTIDLGIVYHGPADVEGYTDSDWAGDVSDRKSTTGYVFKLTNGPISWASRKQKLVALSSTEAEYYALNEAGKEAVFIRQFLTELSPALTTPMINHRMTLKNDNMGAEQLSQNPQHHARTKHIEIRHHWIRDAVKDHSIQLLHVDTNDNVADGLTKPLAKPKFETFIQQLSLK